MKVIYIDTLFITNLAADYLLLLLSGQVCGVILRRRRYLVAAALGSVYAVAVYLPGAGALALPAAKLGAGLVMAAVAYGGEARMLRCAAVFMAVSAAFGGFIWAIELAGGHPAFDARTLIVSFAVCYILLSWVLRRRGAALALPRARVVLTLGEHSAEFTALVDSGNALTDPVSALPVMVVCPHVAAPLLGVSESVLCADAVALCERAVDGRAKLRLVPYSAVGGAGLLAAFRPDSVTVNGEKREMLAAISPAVAGDGYDGIIADKS